MTTAEKKRKKYGKAVRISLEVKNYLEKRQRGEESYDSILRRLFGLPTRKGEEQSLRSFYIVPAGTQLIAKQTLAEARGEAMLLAVRKGIKKADSVITVQEIP